MSPKIFQTRNVLMAASAVALLAGGAAAFAQTGASGAGSRFSVAAERVEAQGFTILEMDRDRNGFDVEAIAKDGRHMDLDVDAAGVIKRQRLDD
ncbi:PepSY domain-containing protein [Caulobacter sp. NIBR2454]|uniref:PepSY domain-containing protein n=1 Tax=Caulobacter sp. NIBR2454 TaxID=3015996 RepID=UPI0022B75202|nr:PepSY domain-containing protein [Caulobacter sp. NIBR2454]